MPQMAGPGRPNHASQLDKAKGKSTGLHIAMHTLLSAHSRINCPARQLPLSCCNHWLASCPLRSAAKVGDRVQYSGMLSSMMKAVVGYDVSPQKARAALRMLKLCLDVREQRFPALVQPQLARVVSIHITPLCRAFDIPTASCLPSTP